MLNHKQLVSIKESIVNYLIRHIIVVFMIGAIFFTGALSFNLFAQINCANTDNAYSVRSGDTLGAIANRNGTTWQNIASYNKISNPNFIFINQKICIPGSMGVITVNTSSQSPIHGSGNFFPQGQCTYWANQRYHEIHGVYVPWTTNSNANQWVDRAHDFHWYTTSTPKMGAIVSFQAGVQGAFSLGHVAYVEQLLPNGHFVASNMDFNYSSNVVNWTFHAGNGVTFISHF